MAGIRDQIRQLTSDRRSPEARALYGTLAKYVERRAHSVVRHAASDLMSSTEVEEVVADVLLQLVTGALLQFRGNSVGELMAFVRTVTDRRLWRVIKKRVKDKRMLEALPAESAMYEAASVRPDQLVRIVPDPPLSDADEAYLTALLEAGSKAELARQRSLSRAAVTQRVQRIQKRIASLEPQEKMAVDAWLEHTARQVLERQA